MSNYLIKYEWNRELVVFNLDISSDDRWVKDELEEFEIAREDSMFEGYKIRNNRFMRIISAESLKDAVDIFFNELKRKEKKEC